MTAEKEKKKKKKEKKEGKKKRKEKRKKEKKKRKKRKKKKERKKKRKKEKKKERKKKKKEKKKENNNSDSSWTLTSHQAHWVTTGQNKQTHKQKSTTTYLQRTYQVEQKQQTHNLKQNEAQGVCAESTYKGGN